MTSSFATYASQFLNRQRSPGRGAPSSQDQPLFFSFATDDGSQHGSGRLRRESCSDLNDGGDPTVIFEPLNVAPTADLRAPLETRRRVSSTRV